MPTDHTIIRRSNSLINNASVLYQTIEALGFPAAIEMAGNKIISITRKSYREYRVCTYV